MDYYELGFSRRRDPPECCPTVDGKLAREWHAGRLEGLGLASEYGDEAVDNAFVLKTGPSNGLGQIPVRHVLLVLTAAKKVGLLAA
jgi:hypothetical protein